MSDPADPWRAWLDGWQRLAPTWPGAQPPPGSFAPFGPDPSAFATAYGPFAEALANMAQRAAQPDGEPLEQRIQRELDALQRQFPSSPFGRIAFTPPPLGAALESFLRAVPLGPLGPSQALLQDLAHALSRWQSAAEQQSARLARAAGEALVAYGDRLRAALARGEPPWRLRQAFDAWIDCGEDAYARLCADDDYVAVQARALNAAVAAVAAWRAVSEAQQRLMGLPSRAELDALESRVRAVETAAAAAPSARRRSARAPRRKRR